MHTEDTRLLAAVQWMMIPVSIDEQLIENAKHLPEDWRQLPAPPSTREFGTQWVRQARSTVLQVPSIVVDGEFNYVLNPRHAEMFVLRYVEEHSNREIAQMIRLRGAETVIVGIQPEVAFAMVQLGLTMEGVATALDLEEGLIYLNLKIKTVAS